MTRSSSSHAAPARRVLKGIPTMIAALLVAAPLAAFSGQHRHPRPPRSRSRSGSF